MGNEAINAVVTVCLAVVGVGLIATLVSRNANTAGVLTAGGQALGGALTAAEGPVLSAQSIGWTGGSPLDMASY